MAADKGKGVADDAERRDDAPAAGGSSSSALATRPIQLKSKFVSAFGPGTYGAILTPTDLESDQATPLSQISKPLHGGRCGDLDIHNVAAEVLQMVNRIAAGDTSEYVKEFARLIGFPFPLAPIQPLPAIEVRAKLDIMGDDGIPFKIRPTDNFAGLFLEYATQADCTIKDMEMVLMWTATTLKMETIAGEVGLQEGDVIIVRPKVDNDSAVGVPESVTSIYVPRILVWNTHY